MTIPIPSADPEPGNLLRNTGFLMKIATLSAGPKTRKFAAYNWIPILNETPHPRRRPWTRKIPAGERCEFPIPKLHLSLVVFVLVLSQERKAGSAGNENPHPERRTLDPKICCVQLDS